MNPYILTSEHDFHYFEFMRQIQQKFLKIFKMFIFPISDKKIVNIHRNKGKIQEFFNGPLTIKNFNEYL